MTSVGRVRAWDAQEGWGGVDPVDTPGGCWAHYSCVHASGYLALDVGAGATSTFERFEQDGHAHRAVDVWPDDDA